MTIKPIFFRGLSAWIMAGFLSVQSVPGQEPSGLLDGLAGYWTFDELDGDTAGDASGAGRAARVWDAPPFADSQLIWTEGRFGGAVEFDATYFLAAQDFYGIGGTEPRTIAFWILTAFEYQPGGGNVAVAWGPNVNTERWHFKLEGSNGALRTENQGGNNFGAVPVTDGEWHHVVSVFSEGGSVVGDVDHYVDGVLDETKNGGVANPVNTNIDPAVAPLASIGGSPFGAGFRYIAAVMDDVRIYDRALSPEEIAALAAGEGVIAGAPPRIIIPAGLDRAPFHDHESGIQITIRAVGDATVNPENLSMTVNGEDVTAALEITGDDTERQLSYTGLEANLDYAVEINATDSAGLFSRRTLSFSTFDSDLFVVEAEDYNFEGGGFIQNPVLCNTIGGAEDCYFDKQSVAGVDAFDTNGNSDDATSFDSIYRYSTGGPDREEEFDTFASGDVLRAKFEGQSGVGGPILDYDITLLDQGDWANYTREFPEGAYSIRLRARSSVDQRLRLDRVTSDPAAPDQTTSLLGYFHVPASGVYTFAPLSDFSGENQITFSLPGNQTLRLTAEEANANLDVNFFLFVPTELTTILPTVAVTAPENGAVLPEDQDFTIQVAASDEDGFVRTVLFYRVTGGSRTLLGEDSEAPYEWVISAPAAGAHTFEAEAVDNADLVAVSTPVDFVVDSTPPTLLGVRASPDGAELELLLSEQVDPAILEDLSAFTIDPDIGVVEAFLHDRRLLLLTGFQEVGTEYTVTVAGLTDLNGLVNDSVSGSATAAGQNLFYGLEGYWTFDEGAGTVARDLSGYGRDAVIYNVPEYEEESIQWVNGTHIGAIDFTGSYFLAAHDYFGVGGFEPRTISMWIKTLWPNPTGSNTLVGWGANANEQRWHFKLETTNRALRTENQGGNNFGSIPVTDGEWHHVVSTFPSFGAVVGDVDHYVDGVWDETKSGGTGQPVNTSVDPAVAAPVTLGGAPLGLGGGLRPIVALIDDVRVYSRGLSYAEIVALFEGNGVLEGGPGPVELPELSVALNLDGTVTIAWTGAGVLQFAPSVTGEWQDVPDASNPMTVAAEGTRFYRIRP